MRPIFIAVQLFLMIGVPVWLAFYYRRKWNLSGRILAIGVGFFIISQIINTPLRIGTTELLGPHEYSIKVIFCFIAGFGEELSRWIAMKWVTPLKGNINPRTAMLYGFGHGGFEAVLFGAGVLMMAMFFYSGLGDAFSGDEEFAKTLQEFGAVPAWHHLMGGIERVCALIIHLAASLIVAQVFIQKRWMFLPAAMAFHGVVNFIIIAVHEHTGSILLTESTAVVMALISLGIIRAFREEPLIELVEASESREE